MSEDISTSEERRRRRSGFTLLEVVVSVPLVLVAGALVTSAIIASGNQRSQARESLLAATECGNLLERMRNEDFRMVFALYDADPFNDPSGPGTAPGAAFAVESLEPLPDDPDGVVGSVTFPAINTGSAIDPVWELREDQPFPALGTPRDLNGDSVVDALDHAADYALLPVRIELRWQGRHGPREFHLQTIVADWIHE